MAAYTTNEEIDEVLKRHHTNMFYFVLKKLKYDECLAEDVYQDACIKIFLALRAGKYTKGKGTVSTWMYKICSNVIHDHYRERKKNPAIPNNALFNEDTFEEGSGFYRVIRKIVEDKHTEDQDRQFKVQHDIHFKMVEASIKKIETYNDRMCLYYQFVKGDSSKRIASKLMIKENTVRTNIFRAKKKLREIILEDKLIAA